MLLNLFRKKTDFIGFVDYFLKTNSHLYHPETIKTYKTQISKLQRFRTTLYFEDIDKNFLFDYQKYMIVSLKNKPNTYFKTLAWLKSMTNHAIRLGVIKEHHAFDKFKILKETGNRPHLNEAELKRLHQYFESTKLIGVKNVLGYFLFSCYTGLRYTDIRLLKCSDISDNMIEIEQHKTNKTVKIPLTHRAAYFLEDSKKKYCFESISNQKTNDHLKRIAKDCNINKRLSFHVARHTFATLGLTLGIPLEVISKLLGHTDIKTTQIYAHFRDGLLVSEMKKFENLEVLA